MIIIRGKLSYTQARRLDVSYLVWRTLRTGICHRISSAQGCLPAFPRGGFMSVSVSRLSPPVSTPVHYVTKRHISLETYEKYFSPDSPPIALAMNYLNVVHDMTGLPWFATIGICTIFLRFIVALPLRIVAKKNAGKNKVVTSYIQAFTESMKYQVKLEAAKQNWNEKKAKGIMIMRVNQGVRKARQQTGAHPIKTALYPMLQIPVWLCMSFALRNMSGYRVLSVEAVLANPEMIREGAFWFSNLLVPDPTMIIALTLGALHLINNEVNTYNLPKGIGTSVIKWLGRGLSLAFIPFACIVPSAISLYWTYSAFTAVIVSLILNLERSKKYLQLEPPGTPEYYYRYYKAMIEKETGVIVPPEEKKNDQPTSDSSGNSGDKNRFTDHVKPSEHSHPSELSRPYEHNKFSETKHSGKNTAENR